MPVSGFEPLCAGVRIIRQGTTPMPLGQRPRGQVDLSHDRGDADLQENPGRVSHAEPRASHGFDCVGGPAHLDLRGPLAAEEVEEQLAWRSCDAGPGRPPADSNDFLCLSPLKLESGAAQASREVRARTGRADRARPTCAVSALHARRRAARRGFEWGRAVPACVGSPLGSDATYLGQLQQPEGS